MKNIISELTWVTVNINGEKVKAMEISQIL